MEFVIIKHHLAAKHFCLHSKKVKSSNFIFVCNISITKRENQEASSLKEQIAVLTETVNTLAIEFRLIKDNK